MLPELLDPLTPRESHTEKKNEPDLRHRNAMLSGLSLHHRLLVAFRLRPRRSRQLHHNGRAEVGFLQSNRELDELLRMPTMPVGFTSARRLGITHTTHDLFSSCKRNCFVNIGVFDRIKTSNCLINELER